MTGVRYLTTMVSLRDLFTSSVLRCLRREERRFLLLCGAVITRSILLSCS